MDLRRRLNEWEIEEMVTLIGCIDPICLNTVVEDHFVWDRSKDGLFSVKSYREAPWIGMA